MFNGPAGMAAYDAPSGKFTEQNSNNWMPFDYGSVAALKSKADLTVAGALQDCGECHVGGGAMEYVPWSVANMGQRVSLRDIATTPVNGGTPITAAQVTTFNYFVDIYDVDKDGDKTEVQYNDYTKTGVGELDCMMCHLEGYDWNARLHEIRQAKHDTARAVASGLGVANAMVWDSATGAPEGYGTQLGATYAGNMNIDVGEAIPGVTPIKLTANYAAAIKKQPMSANCANCHMANGFGIGDTVVGEDAARRMVDFKKRGDHWVSNRNWDVHSFAAECMDCHANANTATYANNVQTGNSADTGTSGAAYMTGTAGVPVDMTGPDANKLGQCDPNKGDSNFESVWNAKDVAGLNCAGCHTTGSPKKHPLAPDPAAAHAAAGLAATLLQDKLVTNGVATKSHLDMIECSACHIRKLEHYSGGALIDATGKDAEGRMADHENQYTERDMYDNMINIWYKGRMIKANSSISMFWVDKNDVNRDANGDGRTGGLDPLLTTHVSAVNSVSITEEKHGVIVPADITARQTALGAALDGLLGTTGVAITPKLTFMGVPFNVDHNVSPTVKAWGYGGCKDCHAPNAGFYNGTYEAKPKNLNMTFAADTSQVVPFTLVNNGTQKSTYHPAVMSKKENRSLAIDLTSSQTSLRSPDRSEYLYESTFTKPNMTWSADGGVIAGSAITFPSAAANGADAMGWILKVSVKDAAAADTAAVTYTLQNPTSSATVVDVATLIAAMNGAGRANGNLTNGNWGFTVSAGTNNLVLTAVSGKVIRISSESVNAAQMGFAGALYTADPIVGTLGGSYNGRADWVNYLNGIAIAGTAEITAPVGAPVGVVKGVDVTFTANTTGNNPGTKYRWDMGDGHEYEGTTTSYVDNMGTPADKSDDITISGSAASISHKYLSSGEFKARLFAIAPAGGDTKSDSVDVKVNNLAAPGWTAVLNLATTPDQLELAGLPDTTTRVYVVWDDSLKTNQVVGAGTTAVNIPHTYKKVAQRWNGSNFVYNTVVRVYNAAGTLLGSQAVPVTIAP